MVACNPVPGAGSRPSGAPSSYPPKTVQIRGDITHDDVGDPRRRAAAVGARADREVEERPVSAREGSLVAQRPTGSRVLVFSPSSEQPRQRLEIVGLGKEEHSIADS
jgi:hypothetical protein